MIGYQPVWKTYLERGKVWFWTSTYLDARYRSGLAALSIILYALFWTAKPAPVHGVSPEEWHLARRVQAHLVIRDHAGAVKEGRQARTAYPDALPIYESYIRALAQSGHEKECMRVWNEYAHSHPASAWANRELIEEVAWGTLQKAAHSASLVMREMALLAAFLTQDAKGVAILSQGMRDANYAVRAIAVKLAGHLRDRRLMTAIQELFQTETVWSVREQIILAMGRMKAVGFQPQLEAILASEQSSAQEKALAIAALLELLDEMAGAEIDRLSYSTRAGLRQLACHAAARSPSATPLDRLFVLATDAQADVRIAAFQAIGQLRPAGCAERVIAAARRGVQDQAYAVSISAAWLLTLYLPAEGQPAMARWLHDDRPEVRRLAAAALAATGSYGQALAVVQYRAHDDPYVRLNLAIGLIGQRLLVPESAEYLKSLIVGNHEKWSTWESGIFRVIVHQRPTGVERGNSAWQEEDQLLRLELLHLLAMLNVPDIQESIRRYLGERSWEISATAALLLLSEGGDQASLLVEQLLSDVQPRVRLHAALILSLWSRDETAIQVLQEEYVHSHWEQKSRILEGLGRIGSMKSVPFLLGALQEPSQTLRLIAGMALIQCLNH